MGVLNVNCRRGSVRVMCPKCGASGAHYVSSQQPLCDKCDYKVLMEPASNNQIECGWEEFKTYWYQKQENTRAAASRKTNRA